MSFFSLRPRSSLRMSRYNHLYLHWFLCPFHLPVGLSHGVLFLSQRNSSVTKRSNPWKDILRVRLFLYKDKVDQGQKTVECSKLATNIFWTGRLSMRRLQENLCYRWCANSSYTNHLGITTAYANVVTPYKKTSERGCTVHNVRLQRFTVPWHTKLSSRTSLSL